MTNRLLVRPSNHFNKPTAALPDIALGTWCLCTTYCSDYLKPGGDNSRTSLIINDEYWNKLFRMQSPWTRQRTSHNSSSVYVAESKCMTLWSEKHNTRNCLKPHNETHNITAATRASDYTGRSVSRAIGKGLCMWAHKSKTDLCLSAPQIK